MTLSEWLEQMAVTLRPGTLEHYRKDMENHVKPHLGSKLLTQLTAADLRKLYDTLKQTGKVDPRPGHGRGNQTLPPTAPMYTKKTYGGADAKDPGIEITYQIVIFVSKKKNHFSLEN